MLRVSAACAVMCTIAHATACKANFLTNSATVDSETAETVTDLAVTVQNSQTSKELSEVN
jgi:hypothetical protein